MLKKRVPKIYVKGNELVVKVKSFSSLKFQRVAEKFFASLNGRQIKFLNNNNYSVTFHNSKPLSLIFLIQCNRNIRKVVRW